MKKLFALLSALIICAMLCAPTIAESLEPVTQTAPAPVVTIDLTQIVVSIIGLIFSFLLTWLIKAIIPPARKWLEARTTAEQRSMMNTLVRQLVYAAEQTIGTGNGARKLQYVCDQLKKRGFSVDLDVIEASVKEMNDMLLNEITGDEIAGIDMTDDLK